MALRPFDETTDLNDSDSDETHFSPDPDKEQDEVRRADPDNEDAYFERTYNKYLTSPGRWGRDAGDAPLPDSDETFYEPAQVVPDPQQAVQADSLELRVDSDETFFEPSDDIALPALNEYQRVAGSRTDGDEQPGATGMAAEAADRRPPPGLDDEYDLEDVLLAVREHPDEELDRPNPEEDVFLHGFAWSKTPVGAEASDRDVYCGHDVGDGTAGDLYIQMQDPVTQEMRTFLVPGMLSQQPAPPGPESLQLLTQDLEWTQTQLFGLASPRARSPSPQRQEASAAAVPAPGLGHFSQDFRLETQDLCWTQTQLGALGAGCAGDAAPASDSTPDQPMPGSSSADMDVGSVPTAVLESRSSSFMDVAAPPEAVTDAAAARPAPPPAVNSSSLSSEPGKTSNPSFDDDYLLPLSGLTWPLLTEECNIAEIVASLSNISFSLEDHEMAAGLEGQGRGPPPGAIPPATPPSAPSPRTPAAPAPRSPTFTIVPRRRGRPHRARPDRVPAAPLPQASRAAAQAAQAAQAAGGGASTKRKRAGRASGPAGQLLGPSGAQGFSCSPSSPPPQKARKSQSGHSAPSKERQEMIATYSRLQELRFLMQDIIAGREPLPAAEDIPRMREEVLGIIGNIRQAALLDGKLSGKAKQRREEARQVADKILHQLRVLTEESQRSCAGTEDSIDLLAPSTSWNEPSANNREEASTQNCYKSSSQFGEPRVCTKDPRNICTQSQRKRVKERKCRKKKSSVQCHKSYSAQEPSRPLPPINFKFDDCYSNPEQISREQSQTYPAVISQTNKSLQVEEKTLHHEYRPAESASREKIKHFGGPLSPQTIHYGDKCSENIASVSDVCETMSDCIVRKLPFPFKNGISTSEERKLETPGAHGSRTIEQQEISCHEVEQEGAARYLFEEKDPKAVGEYQEMVKLIKESATARIMGTQTEVHVDSIWRGGPLKFTGILLPKSSELHPIDDLPPNFWEDPNAPIPEEWINLLEWDD